MTVVKNQLHMTIHDPKQSQLFGSSVCVNGRSSFQLICIVCSYVVLLYDCSRLRDEGWVPAKPYGLLTQRRKFKNIKCLYFLYEKMHFET